MGVSQLFDPFLVSCEEKGAPQAGEFFWVPAPELKFHVLEAKRSTPDAHARLDFVLGQFDAKKHYREKDHLPVKLLGLGDNTEALLFKSKLRPCLVLGSACVSDHATLASVSDQRMSKVLAERCYLVAPLQSANSPSKPNGPFPPELVARIKMLQYAHLSWVRDFKGQGAGSILRLDRIFPTTLGVGMHRCGQRLHDDVMDIVVAQASQVLGITMSDELASHLQATKELVAACAPPELSAR